MADAKSTKVHTTNKTESYDGKGTLAALLFVVFLDLVGFGIIIPILPVLFFEANVFSDTVTLPVKTFLLGLLIAVYPISQFFGAPILGSLSDKHGRKKILMFSIFGSAVGYAIMAVGIIYSNIYLLFLSRIVDGATGGNISIARSAIADISDEKSKTKNFGLIGMAFGLGFILGPFIGGKLSDPLLHPSLNFATPFWFAAALSAVNLLLIQLLLRETLKKSRDSKINAFTGFANIRKAFKLKHIRILLLCIFLMDFGWAFFTQFFQVYLYDKFNYSPSNIGTLFAYVGIWIAISQGLIIRPLSHKFKPYELLRFSMLAVSIVLLLLLLPEKNIHFYFLLPLLAMSIGFIHPNFSTLVSNSVGPEEQGEMFGIMQSLMSLSQAIPPLIAGLAIAFSTRLPIILSSATIFVAWAIFTQNVPKAPLLMEDDIVLSSKC